MKKILVRAPNWIGDQILAFPFFYHLRRAYPDAQITSICVEWVRDLQFRSQVDDVFVLPVPAENTLHEKFKILEIAARALREQGPWDLAISLPNSFSAAWLLWRSRAVRRRGYRVDGRGIFLNQGLRWNSSPDRHRAQAYVDLLPETLRPARPIREFWGVPPENDLDPEISGELESFDLEKEWLGVAPIEPPSHPYWILAPGSKAESRRWPLSSYSRLVKLVFEQTGWIGRVIGSQEDRPLAEHLCEENPGKVENHTGNSAVTALWKLFRNTQFTVTNESGLAHVASICGSFVQVVCGAADPRRTRPLGPGRVQVTVNPVECWPCERNRCFQPSPQTLQCLKGIDPDSVWAEIQRGKRLGTQ